MCLPDFSPNEDESTTDPARSDDSQYSYSDGAYDRTMQRFHASEKRREFQLRHTPWRGRKRGA
jgi:hypothetical protein